MLADEIPRMNRGMTVCGSMTVRGGISSSRYLLAGSRDTMNKSRYDVLAIPFFYLAWVIQEV
ncbi:hypothetical protein NMD99_03100 [Wolbachia endosymbiont of Listronotus oregonensis]|uniref:hypothetical protein n=2 Tax=unclassified Wolbachia TaxID=2640676 RepID=UPI002814F137|nr:hypothetical protein [Wolbachia endosymbiont of Listronotus oregonensis]WMT84975.1 hypothetical protein NMD99_03100 [Wolbachia endosymbiont of Listronotus oregonensis]